MSRLVTTLVLLAISAVAGFVAEMLGLPLPFLLGPLLVTGVIATALPAALPGGYEFPQWLRTVFIAVIGLMIGAQVTPELFAGAERLLASTLALTGFVLLALGYNFAVFRRLGGYDRATAFYSSTPGGLYESLALGEEAGAQMPRLILQQFLRIIIVVTVLPIGLSLWIGAPVGSAGGMTFARAAVPWQGVRRREAGTDPNAPLIMRKDDLRVRRFEEKAARVTIFAVDASGSAAAARLAEAKGAVELMLAQAYVTRSEVALIAFRGEVAELLLPPTRSLTRARRALAELPGGGGTPLAMGLNTARELSSSVRGRGRTPSLIVLTDGRANIDAAGQPGRKQAGEDAKDAAKAIAREGIDALVVDISARASREGGDLAETMQARYLALPRADAKTLHAAISSREPA